MVLQYKKAISVVSMVGFILLIPLIATLLSDQVNWNVGDFAIAALLLLTLAFGGDLVYRKVNQSKYKIIIWMVLLIVFILVWAELAVGIFGTPFAGS
ncbi:MAG: hypothetical protein AAF502_07040 [Bacteroidota bacterium]